MLYMQKHSLSFLPIGDQPDYRNFYSSKNQGGIYKDSIHEPDYLSWFERINNIEGNLYK